MSDNTHTPDSVMGRLAAKRQEIEQGRHVVLDIPGWSGLLQARYTSIPWEVIRSGIKENPTPNEELVLAWDTLVAACECVLVEGKPHGEPPVRYDQSLARLTGDNVSVTPREVISAVFPTEMALMTHFNAYMEWLSGSTEQNLAELGKSLSQTSG